MARPSTILPVDFTRRIERPVEVVFDTLADLSGYSRWMHRTWLFGSTDDVSDEPVGPGTRFRDRTRIGRAHGEVTEFERPTRLAFRATLRWFGDEVVESRPSYHLEPADGGTLVHFHGEAELLGWFRVTKPISTFLARTERIRTVESLKRHLESS